MTRMSHRTPREGLVSQETLEAIKEADRKLVEVFYAIEDAALMLSEDVAGGRAGHDVSDETMEACAFHPLYNRLWSLVEALEEHGVELKNYLLLEEGR